MALHRCKTKHRSLSKPSLVHLFSTSQNDNNDNDGNDNNSLPSSLNSYFSDVKASLRKQQQNQTMSFAKGPSTVTSLEIEQIRKNLAEFRKRSAASYPMEKNSTVSGSKQFSFQELYERNTINEGKPSRNLSWSSIRESIRNLEPNNSNTANRSNVGSSADSLSLSAFKSSLKLKPEGWNTNRVIGGTSQELPVSVFGKEMMDRQSSGEGEVMKTEFLKTYRHEELGEKLRNLRPQGLEGGFSLKELSERLMKVREMDEKETQLLIGGFRYDDLRESLKSLSSANEEKTKMASTQRVLSHLGGTPNLMLHPPKEHLVDKFFHPDNMSSAEKMKIELEKVREEFKMSESDCGSARVQIAQLTTKIKHLSKALHKKDKHSLKGLQAMVQRRKRLLKYLRRTDWDSYCIVLSKLDLRDNPEYKTLT